MPASRRAFSARPMSDIAPKTADPPASFESALAELETIVATMEGGQLPLAESLAAYKRGAELLQYCQAALKDAQQQVQVLERGVLKVFAPGGDDAEASRNDES
jgi:exodeoxyribonuclease VII small subunit